MAKIQIKEKHTKRVRHRLMTHPHFLSTHTLAPHTPDYAHLRNL